MIDKALINKLRINKNNNINYPFTVPVIANLQEVDLNHDVIGDIGSGKSTILELIATKLNLYRISEDLNYQNSDFKEIKEAIKYIDIDYLTKPKGFFFRSEDFITYIHFLENAKNEALLEIKRIDEEYKDRSSYAKGLAKMPHYRKINDIDNMFQQTLYEESF